MSESGIRCWWKSAGIPRDTREEQMSRRGNFSSVILINSVYLFCVVKGDWSGKISWKGEDWWMESEQI